MASLGDLERVVMDVLWDAAEPITAYDVQERLSSQHGRDLAVTTVLTVLTRLTRKRFVSRDSSARPHHFVPEASRSEHVAKLMHEVLGESRDRVAVLERFVGGVSDEDAELLRSLLRGGS